MSFFFAFKEKNFQLLINHFWRWLYLPKRIDSLHWDFLDFRRLEVMILQRLLILNSSLLNFHLTMSKLLLFHSLFFSFIYLFFKFFWLLLMTRRTWRRRFDRDLNFFKSSYPFFNGWSHSIIFFLIYSMIFKCLSQKMFKLFNQVGVI